MANFCPSSKPPVSNEKADFVFLLAVGQMACDSQTPRERMFDELRAQRDVITPFPMSGLTYASFDPDHGYQVEYLSPDGRAYLWYTGSRKSVIGECKTHLYEVCYRYGSNTFNPQTLQRGGSWNCEYAVILGYRVTACQQSYIINLKSGRLPYVRERCDLPKGLAQVKEVNCK